MEVDPAMQLTVALAVMFFGALIAGALPYMIKVNEAQLKTVAALGGGLLIGTSLAVVIPEGFHALAEGDSHAAHLHSHSHNSHEGHLHAQEGGHGGADQWAGLVLVAGFIGMLILDHLQHAAGATHLHAEDSGGHQCSGSGGGGGSGAHSHSHGNGGGRGHGQSHGHAGLPQPPCEPPPPPLLPVTSGGSCCERVYEGGDLLQEHQPLVLGEPQQPALAPDTPGGKASSPKRAITGLMVHCAADGLAMGAAALSGDLRLSMMIAVAMCVHKAPMAFGLATYLMNYRWPWAKAQSTMVLFAAMAPLGAIVTYSILGHIPAFTSTSAVALVVLFSGGTFLYAATMHILPEVLGAGCHLSMNQIAAVSLGGVLPALLSFGHEH